MNGMGNDEKLAYLPNILEGSAYTVYSNLTPAQQGSYKAILDALEEQYGPANRRAELFKKLYNTKQLPGQSVLDYAGEIQKRMNHLGVVDPTQVMYQFISGLYSTLSNAVLRMRPKTIQEAISHASLAESTSDGPSSQLDTGLILGELTNLAHKIDDITTSAVVDPSPIMAVNTFPNTKPPSLAPAPPGTSPRPAAGQNPTEIGRAHV
jgi:hypothetical protein